MKLSRYHIMRGCYSALFYLCIPGVLIRLLWRAKRAPAYARRWRERFALFDYSGKKHGIWLHAVSLGEVIAAAPLINTLRTQYPDKPIIVTTLTPTGSERVRSLFTHGIFHSYAPYDLPDAVNRFLNKIEPDLAIMIETELWPNMIAGCHQRQIPVIIANARMSPNSFKGYHRIHWFMQGVLQQVTHVIAQSAQDAKRYQQIGMDPQHITVSGSLKFDLHLPPSLFEKAASIRQWWGNDRAVWIAASTHDPEEELILSAFADVRKQLPHCLLVLVPRHPERFNKVTNLCRKQGYNVVRRSDDMPCNATVDIFIGDSVGELCAFYAAADVAYVGGSLIPNGGHNPLEPAACGIPVLYGPHTFNFTATNALLEQAGAAHKVNSVAELAQQTTRLLQDAAVRQHMGNAGKNVVNENCGALTTHLNYVEQLLSTPQQQAETCC